MQAARTLALACLVLGAQVAPAEAVTLSLSQIGGTAVDGVGYVGDSVVVGIDITLEASDVVQGVGPTLQWDLEGGNVLDLVRATESQNFAGGAFRPVNGAYRQGAVGTLGDYFDHGLSFPRRAGPTFAVGWEQVGFPWGSQTSLAGPASFRVGTASFVFREVGGTTLGFVVDPNVVWNTFVFGQGDIDETGNTTFESLDLSAVGFGQLSLTVLAVPEPGSAILGGAGLVGLGLASRTRGRGRQAAARLG